MLKLQAKDIASLCLHQPTDKSFQIQLQSTEHRIALVSSWDIPEGSKVLELGCGQGDCTAVLAELVGPSGKVTGVDPASLDYGCPFTLRQSQSHLSSGRLGPRINWVQANPLEFLESDTAHYDVAVLALCIWYFGSPADIRATLNVLAKRVDRICIAEWSLSSPTAHTHVLAALAEGALECHNPAPLANIRTIASPAFIRQLAEELGWSFLKETTITPAEHVLDGRWEVEHVKNPTFLKDIDRFIADERQRSVVIALRDAMLASLERAGAVDKVTSMDVWCAVFTR